MLMMSCKIGFGQLQSGDVNGELRVVLGGLSVPTLHSPFFYDFVAHATDEKWFVKNNLTDTNNFFNWYNVYDEMKYSARDTTILPNTVSLLRKAESISRLNQIPIGIFNFDFEILNLDAFDNQGEYFTWDDNNIYDVSTRTNSPYTTGGVFMGSLLNHNSNFRNVTFRISPELIFHSSIFRYINGSVETEKLYIDFGDGNGWQYFDESIDQTFDVLYPSEGKFIVKFGIFSCDPYPNCSTSPMYTSQSIITIKKNIVSTPPQIVLNDIPGITYGVYEGCNPGIKKRLFFLEGVDLNNTKSIEDNYDELFMKESKWLKSVRAYDYEVIIVNWDNSISDIRKNATSIVKLLEKYKTDINEEENEQFIIIGESLGGIIGRCALNYMESEAYKNNQPIVYIIEGEEPLISPLYVKTNLMHNTRLFIAIDAGFEGVYFPVSAQHALNKLKDIDITFPALNKWGNYFPIGMLTLRAERTFEMLQSKAVKQLLVYHINTYNNPNNVGSHSFTVDKSIFDEQVYQYKHANNGMPEFCKVVTISSGLLNGIRQTDWFKNELLAGYNLMSTTLNLKKKIFRRVTKQVFNLNFSMKALPELGSTLDILDYTAIHTKFTIRGCLKKLFKGDGNCGNTDFFDYGDANVHDVIPYEVISGGNFNVFKLLGENDFESSEEDAFLYAYKYNYKPSIQNVSVDFSYGILTPKYLEVNITSDALTFCFIPVRSALSYYPSNYNDWELDLYSQTNFSTFKNTGSDVIVGFAKSSTFPNAQNGFHSYFENYLRRLAPGANSERMIQREIGDDELFLDNFKVNRPMQITINDDVYLGGQNPEYEYLAPEATGSAMKYYLSRNEPLEMIGSNKLKIVSNNSPSINTSNCSNCNLNDNIEYINASLSVCRNMLRTVNSSSNSSDLINELTIYPNPTTTSFTLYSPKLDFNKIIVRNNIGQIIEVFNFNKFISDCDIDVTKFVNGIYFVEILMDDNQLGNFKLVVNK
jgi:hypothetical protein